jgi:hypothetical protein
MHRRVMIVVAALSSLSVSSALAQAAGLLRGTPFDELALREIGRSLDLGAIAGATIAADGSVIVIDRTVSRAYRITAGDSIVATYGAKGTGPGEFRYPQRVVERSDRSVLIYDLETRAFSEFEAGGRFRRRWSPAVLFETVDDLVALPNKQIAVSGVINDGDASTRSVHVLDSTFRRVRSFGALPPAQSREKLEMFGAGTIDLTGDGRLLFLSRLPYRLTWFSPDGAQLRRVDVPIEVSKSADDAFIITQDGDRVTERFNPALSQTLQAHQLPDGRVLSSRRAAGKQFWDLISVKGQLLWSGPRPERVHGPLGIDRARGTAWFSGESADGEPVLYHARFGPATSPPVRRERGPDRW